MSNRPPPTDEDENRQQHDADAGLIERLLQRLEEFLRRIEPIWGRIVALLLSIVRHTRELINELRPHRTSTPRHRLAAIVVGAIVAGITTWFAKQHGLPTFSGVTSWATWVAI